MKVSITNRYFNVKKAAFILFLFLLVVLLFNMSLLILARFKPVFAEKTAVLAKARATEVINSAVMDVFSGIESDDYVNIIKKDTGEITSISADAVKMNKLKACIANAVSDKCESCEDFYIYIPLGSLTNHPVLQGVGYRIPVKISLDGVSKTDFEEEFISAGINQVKNKIYIIVTARISIISSFMTVSEEVSTHIPISETIIIGEVPDYYGDKLGVVGR